MILRRVIPQGGMRATEVDGRPVIHLKVLQYDTVDSFGWLWLRGCLTEGIQNVRWPQMTWGHVWVDTLGRGFNYDDDQSPRGGPSIDFYLADFDAVPRAKQAYAQVRSGTIDDCSIGFDETVVTREPTDEERKQFPGVTTVCIKAVLNEVGLVLRGAVPGAKVLAVRSRHMVHEQQSANLMAQLAGGAIDLYTALGQLKEIAVELPDLPPAEAKSQEEPEGKPEADEPAAPAEEEPVAPEEQPAAPAEEQAPASPTEEPKDQPAQPTGAVIDPPRPDTEPEPQPEPTPEPAPQPEPDPELEQLLAQSEAVLAAHE